MSRKRYKLHFGGGLYISAFHERVPVFVGFFGEEGLHGGFHLRTETIFICTLQKISVPLHPKRTAPTLKQSRLKIGPISDEYHRITIPYP